MAKARMARDRGSCGGRVATMELARPGEPGGHGARRADHAGHLGPREPELRARPDGRALSLPLSRAGTALAGAFTPQGSPRTLRDAGAPGLPRARVVRDARSIGPPHGGGASERAARAAPTVRRALQASTGREDRAASDALVRAGQLGTTRRRLDRGTDLLQSRLNCGAYILAHVR